MLNTFATILIAAALVFGGGGVVVASAQSSQPDNLLYGIKLLSEDIQLQLTTNPETQYQISLDFVDRRAEEIRTMLEVDGIPPESVVVRYQNQVEQTIRYALNLPDEQTVEALEQVQLRLQTHEQSMLNIKTNASPKAETSLLQIQQMIQEQLRIVEGDLSDPTQLREQIRSQDQLREQDQTRTSIPEGQANQTESGTGNGNPWTTGIPTQNSGYGPGPGPEPACTCTPKLGENSNQQSGQPSLIGPQATLVPGGQGGKQ